MTKKGQAGRALGAALTSSLVAGLEGAIILAISIPIMRPLVLFFGAPELFMLTILGITFLATLSSASLSKGVLAGGIGLAISAVGIEDHTGTLRYTMGTIYLWEGLSLAPVVVGLFAIPEIVDLAVRGSSIAGSKVERISGVLEGVKDTFRHFWLTMRCGMIGVMVGAVPGVGRRLPVDGLRPRRAKLEGQAAFRNRGGGRRTRTRRGEQLQGGRQPHPHRRLRGSGDHRMAILLGAFLIVGLTPGPDMLTKHLDVTLAMVWILVISNILAAGVAFLFLSQLVKLTFVRGNLLIPFLVVFVFLGAFSANNHFADIVVACVFGVLGYFMVLFGWPRAPFVLGLVLGTPCGEVPRDLAGRLPHGLAPPPARSGHDRDSVGKCFYSVYKRMSTGNQPVEGRVEQDEL